MRLHRSGWLAALLLTAAMGLQAQEPAATATPAPTATAVISEQGAAGPVMAKKEWAPSPVFGALPDTTEAVRIGDSVLTVANLKLLLNIRPLPEFNAETQLPKLRGEDLRYVAQHAGAFRLMAAEARKRGITLEGDNVKRADNMSIQYQNSLLYRAIVTDKLAEPTEEELQKYYEEKKDELFRRKEEFQLRHIFASAYADYEVKAGDTLESIAKTIGGDETLAPRILSEATKKPRVEGLKEADKAAGKETESESNPPEKRAAEEKSADAAKEGADALPPRALMVGEKLMVPTVGEKAKAAEAKIGEAMAALRNGEKFEDVAKKFSESENPGVLMTVRPEENEKGIMPELRAAFLTLEDGKFSEPLRTKHGFQIVFRERYVAPGHQAFEDVKQLVLRNLRNDRTRELVETFFAELMKDTAVVTVHDDKLTSVEPKPEDVLATIGGKEITRKEFTEKSAGAMDKPENVTPEGFRKLVWQLNFSQAALLDAYRASTKMAERPDVKFAREAIEDSLLADAYLDKVVQERNITVSEEEIRKYYEERKGYYHEREKFDVIAIVVNADKTAANKELAADEAVMKLAGYIKGIQSVEEFRQKAKEVNPPDMASNGGDLGPVEVMSFPDSDVAVLRAVKAPGISTIVRQPDRATAYWLRQVIPEHTASLEEKREEIVKALKPMREREVREELVEAYRREARVEVLVPDEPMPTPQPTPAPKGS